MGSLQLAQQLTLYRTITFFYNSHTCKWSWWVHYLPSKLHKGTHPYLYPMQYRSSITSSYAVLHLYLQALHSTPDIKSVWDHLWSLQGRLLGIHFFCLPFFMCLCMHMYTSVIHKWIRYSHRLSFKDRWNFSCYTVIDTTSSLSSTLTCLTNRYNVHVCMYIRICIQKRSKSSHIITIVYTSTTASITTHIHNQNTIQYTYMYVSYIYVHTQLYISWTATFTQLS